MSGFLENGDTAQALAKRVIELEDQVERLQSELAAEHDRWLARGQRIGELENELAAANERAEKAERQPSWYKRAYNAAREEIRQQFAAHLLQCPQTQDAVREALRSTPAASERIIEAAVQARGRNHAECFQVVQQGQGFLTSTGRFVNRIEALVIATAAGQLDGRTKHRPLDRLMSEDLWDAPAAPPEPKPLPLGHPFTRAARGVRRDACQALVNGNACGQPESAHQPPEEGR